VEWGGSPQNLADSGYFQLFLKVDNSGVMCSFHRVPLIVVIIDLYIEKRLKSQNVDSKVA